MNNKEAIEWIEYMWTEYEGVNPSECKDAVKMAIKALRTMKGHKRGFFEGYQKGYADGFKDKQAWNLLSLSGERCLLLGITKEQRINFAIAFLESNGYIVKKDYSKLVGKWAAFRQEGMKPILHGKVINVSINGCCTIRCKNGYMRYVSIEDVIEFCEEKELCYMIKNNR